MFVARRISLALGVASLTSALVPVSAVQAAGPATVTVRVEGQTQTLVPPTLITTTSQPVVKDGKPEDACPGTSDAGALELATAGNWGGKWFGGKVKEGQFEGLGYSIETVAGENHSFGSGAFWELWINHIASEKGACEAPAEAGQEILFAPCSETVSECPTLGIEAPASANVGEPVGVTVKRYKASGEASAAGGASISGAASAATTDATGHATLTFSSAGPVSLQVSAPELVRTETTVCVHAGNDGTCGTTAPSAVVPTPANSATPPPKAVVGPAIVASLTGLIDGHRYARRDAPRVLAGRVVAHAAVTSISLRLRRTYRGRCWAYDGKRERFVRVRCRRGGYFRINSAGDSFSYLLPSRLLPGRYVLDISAADAAGNHTTLVRGTSRIVFYVA
jgi:hypothetical protein